MKGIELSKLYYEKFGKPMIHTNFPEIEHLMAFGLVGSGSECFGYDDEISTDHDFEPSFCIFVPNESILDEKIKFSLERAYSKLPKEFMGYKRQLVNAVGGNRRGVIRTEDFYKSKTGKSQALDCAMDYLNIPDFYMAEAVNGEIFCDNYGEFTAIRQSIINIPRDAMLKKLAGNLLIMAQSGQYNYKRAIMHGETAAAQLAVFEFVQHTMAAIFILNGRYMPYYKWSFRAMRNLEKFSELCDVFEYLISSDNSEKSIKAKAEIIEDISKIIIDELKDRNLTQAVCLDLEKHAYSVNDNIKDSQIRNLNILYAI